MSDLSETHKWFNARHTEAQSEHEQYEVEKARGVACAYLLHYERDGLIPRGVEVPFTLPLIDENTGKDTGHTYSGIIDALVEDQEGNLWFVDHKTASKVDRSYWQELKTNAQITHYLLAALQMHEGGLIDQPVVGFLWDVIQKPGINPKDLTKKAVAELQCGDYCGIPFKPGYSGEERETPRMYGQRVYVDYTASPEKHFFRERRFRDAGQLLRRLRNLNVHARGMAELKADPKLGVENEGSCKQFNSLCDYHQICAGDDTDRTGYRPRPERAEGDVRTVSGSLSPSRVQCYQSCTQKYVFRYVDKIEPQRPEYRASLHFGTLVHEAIENWLLGKIQRPIVFPNGEVLSD